MVLVATVRALKYNGGVPKDQLSTENLEALKKGIVNLEKHIENIQKYQVPVVVTLNSFLTDTPAEYEFIKNFCEERGCEFALSEVWAKGGDGGMELAEKVLKTLETKESHFKPLYEDSLGIAEKIETIAKEIYGAGSVSYSPAAKKAIAKITDMGFSELPVCMAKTQYSLSDDQTKLGRPEGFELTVRDVYVSAGAGFVVALTGAIMTMPGLPKKPAADSIDVDENGRVRGIWATPQMVSAIKDGRAGIQPTGEPDVYIPCDVLIRAIGQDIETSHFEEAGVPVQRGKIITRSTGDFENMPGVFAGGDCASGPASVIKAIAAAKVVAANIDEYLGFRHEISCDVEIPDANLEDRTPCGRVNLTEREACQRVHDFEGVENCMTEKEARQEADRCLRCDHFGYGIFKGGRDTIW